MNVGTFTANFGGYILALIVILLLYACLEVMAPQYAKQLAMVTLLGIVLFYFAKNKG